MLNDESQDGTKPQMKVLLYAFRPTADQRGHIHEMLRTYTGSNAAILVGEPSETGDCALRILRDEKYPTVVLYATGDRSADLDEGWALRKVKHVKCHRKTYCHNGLNHGRETIEAMAIDADRCLISWDGIGLDSFAVILCMATLGKPLEVIRPEGVVEEVRSFDDLRQMLPARNPQHRAWNTSIPLRSQQMAVERFIPSKSIVEGLATTQIRKREIVDIIVGSPTSLEDKLEALTALSRHDDLLHEVVDETERLLDCAGENEVPEDRLANVTRGWSLAAYGTFSIHRDAIAEGLEALRNTGPGEIIYRKSFWDERPELFEQHEQGIAPFSSIDAALDDLRFEMARDEWDDDAPFWSTFEKWRLTSDGVWENPFTYYAIMDEIVFFDRNAYDAEEHCWAAEDKTYGGSIAPDLNIRVPFETGDVITLDCRPFAPLRHALVLEAERDGCAECCMPRVLHLDDYETKRRGEPMWTEAGPKHASSMRLCMPGYSPLYRMELYEGPLPEEERLIAEVRDWMRGDAAKGMRLSEALMCEMSSDKIRGFMANPA